MHQAQHVEVVRAVAAVAAEPPVNLALNAVGGATGPNNPVAHFGVQVKSAAAVQVVAGRLREAGLATRDEENVTCCYALQDKFWVTGADNRAWEIYTVLADAPQPDPTAATCCGTAPTP